MLALDKTIASIITMIVIMIVIVTTILVHYAH